MTRPKAAALHFGLCVCPHKTIFVDNVVGWSVCSGAKVQTGVGLVGLPGGLRCP